MWVILNFRLPFRVIGIWSMVQVLKAFELTVVAQEGSARALNGLSEKSTRVDRDLVTPMKVGYSPAASCATSI